jgi:DNA invertase Pin-like site-specific DNA recombinase
MARPLGPTFRWGIYTRRSAYNREVVDGKVVLSEESTETQWREVASHIKANNLGIIAVTYTEVESAFNEKKKRPEYENALDDLARGRIDGLACYKLDRLIRRNRNYREVQDVLQQTGGRLLALKDNINTGSEQSFADGFMLDFLARSAEQESRNISVRVISAHGRRARQGKTSRSSVRGFGHSADYKKTVPAEIKLLEEAITRIAAGETLGAICRDWTARKVKTPTGSTHWHSHVLRRLLLSPRMVAKRQHLGVLYDLQGVPPIFNQETWANVHVLLNNDYMGPVRRAERAPIPHLLSGIALCGLCRETLATNSSGKRSTLVYACRPHFEGDTSACGKVSVVASMAEARVREEVLAFISDHERVRALLRRYASGPELDATHDRIDQLSDSLLALGAALNPPPGVPRIDMAFYFEQVSAIEAERAELNKSLAVTREAGLIQELLTFEDAGKEWDAHSQDWQRTILKLVTASIVIEPVGKASATPGRNVFRGERVVVEFSA